MTEQEWLASSDPAAMLNWLRTSEHEDRWHSCVTDRKLRLFACACARSVWHLLTDDSPCRECHGTGKHRVVLEGCEDLAKCGGCSGTGRINRSRRAVEVAERFADGLASEEELDRAIRESAGVAGVAGVHRPGAPLTYPLGSVEMAPCYLRHVNQIDSVLSVASGPRSGWPGGSLAFAADLLRHIVGSPFRPWVVAQAEQDRRALSSYQILDMDCLTPLVLDLARSLYAGEQDAAGPLSDAIEESGQSELAAHFRSENHHPKGCWLLDIVLGKD